MINSFRSLLVAMALLVASPFALAEKHPAQDLVETIVSEMLAILNDDADKIANDPDWLQARVDEIVVPHLDFGAMTKLAVGKFWRKASDEQKTELVDEFRQLLLNTYTGAMTEYRGETINFAPFRPEKREDRAIVRSVFSPASGDDVPVNYKLRDKGGWRIYDIEVNGISLVTNYRTAFASEISKGGIDGLITTLKERNARGESSGGGEFNEGGKLNGDGAQ